MTELHAGDVVAIDGTKRVHSGGRCCYLPEQMSESGLLLHTGTGKVWTGTIERMQGTSALVGGGWRGVECLVLIRKGKT